MSRSITLEGVQRSVMGLCDEGCVKSLSGLGDGDDFAMFPDVGYSVV